MAGWSDRFLSKVRKGPSCWTWTGWQDREGYGYYWVTGDGKRRVHRIAYWLWVGPIPDGYTIDHTCHNDTDCPGGFGCPHRLCVNPDHLEAVPMRVNVLRGNTLAARNARATHCTHGHEFTPENTYDRGNGRRECRVCVRERMAARRARERLVSTD